MRWPRVRIIAYALPFLIIGVLDGPVLERPLARPGDAITLGGARVTFWMPDGWQRMPCPDNYECAYLRTPRGADAIEVILSAPLPAPISTEPAAGTAVATLVERDRDTFRFTINGVRFDEERLPTATMCTAAFGTDGS